MSRPFRSKYNFSDVINKEKKQASENSDPKKREIQLSNYVFGYRLMMIMPALFVKRDKPL